MDMTYTQLKELVESFGWEFYDHKSGYEIKNKDGKTKVDWTKGNPETNYNYLDDEPEDEVAKALKGIIDYYSNQDIEDIKDTDNPECVASEIVQHIASMYKRKNYPLIRNWPAKKQLKMLKLLIEADDDLFANNLSSRE